MRARTILTVGAALGALAMTLISCGKEDNPYTNYNNVDVRLINADSSGGVYYLGDTVTIEIQVDLVNLVKDIQITVGDSTFSAPTDESGEYESIMMLTLTFDSAGTYTIEAVATKDNDETCVTTTMVEIRGIPPQVTIQPADTVRVAQGSPCTLTVQAIGTAPLAYVWYKDSDSIAVGPSYAMGATDSGDAGTYACIITSTWGKDTSRSTVLEVQPPDWIAAPIGLQIRSQSSSFVLSWNGVDNAEGYLVYHSTTAYDPDATGETVTGATVYDNDTVYHSHAFWVRAYRAGVQSEPSDTVMVADSSEQPPPGNNPPFWLVEGDTLTLATAEGTPLRVNLDSLGRDPDAGDELTFAVVDAPAGVHIDHDTMLVIDAGARSGGLLEFSLTADDGDTSVTLPARVTISETTYSLTLDTSSTGGSVVLSPSRATWRWGDSLTLTARPDEGYRFDSWSGDTSTADTVLTVVMTDDMSLTASFSLIPGACQPVAAGTSLNAAIKQASGAETKPQWLCPAEGKYESGTVEVWGTVKVAIE